MKAAKEERDLSSDYIDVLNKLLLTICKVTACPSSKTTKHTPIA